MKIESLEPRKLFAVTWTQGFPNFWEGQGTDAVENVVIVANGSNVTVDGVSFGNASAFTIHMGGGNDSVEVYGSNGPHCSVSALGDAGRDLLVSNNISAGFWGGTQNDTIELNNSFRGEAYGEDGNDSIKITGGSVDARVHGGAGDDVLDGTGAGCPVFFFGEDGNDTLKGSNYGDILDVGSGTAGIGNTVLAGGGDDQIYCRNGIADKIDGGAGTDTAICDVNEASMLCEFPITD
jgi:hypothetical protein